MNSIDIIIAIFLLFGIVKGFLDGFFVSLASLIGLVAGIYGAVHFSHYAANFLASEVSWSEEKINLIAFTITFLIILILIYFLGKALTLVANFAALGLVNKLLGALFGIFRAAFILSVVLLIFNRINLVSHFFGEEIIEESILYAPVENLALAVLPLILEEVQE